MLKRILLPIAGLTGATAVVLGAFGAHGLKDILSATALKTWSTAVDYHFIHALVLLAIGFVRPSVADPKWIDRAAVSGFIGILFFSGSLYVLAFTQIKWVAFVTPFGGLMLISSWLSIAWHGYRSGDIEL